MELLKQKILKDGRALNEHVLLVDSFLNHQVDVKLMKAVGEEFARRFADAGVTRIATIESSGIAPAAMTALVMDLPMVIMKKSVSSILNEGILQTEVFSFTKNAPYLLTLKSRFVKPGDRVLLIDDFLANGEAAFGGIALLEKAGAEVAGVGAVIAKAFQPGMQKLRDAGYRVEALAPVSRMADGLIEFDEH
ncbi:MAG: xanthine phosphoribosyltransferase [Clostridia bacterium]|nr:xanthine phosphoribosyltransferase [Clostridia bacterium]